MSLYVFPKEDTYHLSKDGCANNTPFSLPISDPSNIWGFIYEDETDLVFDANLQAAFYEVESQYLFQIITQPLTIFDDYIIAYDTNGRKYLYFRGLKAGVLASPTFCKFLLGFTDNNGDIYTTYPYKPIGDVYGCGCGDEPTVEIESTPLDDYDCCGIYYGKGINVIYASDPELQAINRTEIYGSLKAAPAQNKVKRFNNCKVKSIDFAKKKRIRYQPVPADYMNLVDCILSSGNIKVDGVDYLVDANNNFDELEAVCLCMFSQDIRLSECNCVKSFGCDVEGCLISNLQIINTVNNCSDPTPSYAYTLSWNVLNVPNNVILSGGDPLLNPFFPTILPISTTVANVIVEANTTAFFTVTNADDPTCFATIQIDAPNCQPQGLRIKFLPNSPELSYTLAQWNTAFNLPVNGTPFTALTVVGDNVYLTNGGFSNVILNNFLAGNANLLEFDDSLVGYIYSSAAGAFDSCPNLTTLLTLAISIIPANYAANCPNLNIVDIYSATSVGDGAFFGSGTTYGVMSVNMPQVVTIVKDAFTGSGIVTVNCPFCTTVGQLAFAFCGYLVSVNLPAATSIGNNCFNTDSALISVALVGCTNFGGSVGNDNVLNFINGITATITVPIALQTCNGGNPDGDLVTFLANNPASAIIYV